MFILFPTTPDHSERILNQDYLIDIEADFKNLKINVKYLVAGSPKYLYYRYKTIEDVNDGFTKVLNSLTGANGKIAVLELGNFITDQKEPGPSFPSGQAYIVGRGGRNREF